MSESGRGRKRPGGKKIENWDEKLKAFGNGLILDGRLAPTRQNFPVGGQVQFRKCNISA
jgi:hypothetical protein